MDTRPFPLTDRFTAALQLAHAWHHGQYRKATDIPYVSHLLGVASVALEFGAGEDEAIAALLHDALEDGPQYTGKDASDLRAEILEAFGHRVAALVDAATDATPKAGEEKAPWPQRKTEYLRTLAHKDAPSLLVSASDKLHNARAILTDVMAAPVGGRETYFSRFNQGQAGTLQYYRLLADAYRAASAGMGQVRLQALFSELDRAVCALEEACGFNSGQVRRFAPLRDALQTPGAST